MAIVRVIMSVALMVPTGAAGAAANVSTSANRSASLRGSSVVGDLSSMAAGCTASWAHNCNSNPTCCEAGFKCFQKTPNWAACLQTCIPGVVQPGDDGKQIPWTCAVLGGGNQGCADEDSQCGAWAADGQCTANSDYMHQHCRLSCGLCQAPTLPPSTSPPSTSPPSTSPSPPASDPSQGEECVDANQQCGEWATNGQCSANSDYMHQHCRLSCSLCQAPTLPPSTSPPSTSPPSTSQPCEDQEDQCAGWAARDQCTENPEYMNVKCKKSCGQCN